VLGELQVKVPGTQVDGRVVEDGERDEAEAEAVTVRVVKVVPEGAVVVSRAMSDVEVLVTVARVTTVVLSVEEGVSVPTGVGVIVLVMMIVTGPNA
jgi:hypothetical protein